MVVDHRGCTCWRPHTTPRAAPLHTAPVSASAWRHEPVAPPFATCFVCLNGSTPGQDQAGLLPASDGDNARGGTVLQRKLASIAVTSVLRESGSEQFLHRKVFIARDDPGSWAREPPPWRPKPAPRATLERGCGLFGLTTCAAVAPEMQADAESAALAKFRA